MRRWSILLFATYAAWSMVAVVEIVGRHHHGHSPWPAWLADHNGNVAVCGFILAAAFPGAGLAHLGRSVASPALTRAGRACVPLAATAFGTFFVLMEFLPLYAPNVADWRDIPASLFGLACGAYFGRRFQQHLERDLAPRRRASSGARDQQPGPAETLRLGLNGSSEFEGWIDEPGRATLRVGYMHPDDYDRSGPDTRSKLLIAHRLVARRQPLERWLAPGTEAYETLVGFPPDADGLRWYCLLLDEGHYFEFLCERVEVVDIDVDDRREDAPPPTAKPAAARPARPAGRSFAERRPESDRPARQEAKSVPQLRRPRQAP